eukprot:scaffold13444_cov30-Tisochrysis_lutea.AAC.2
MPMERRQESGKMSTTVGAVMRTQRCMYGDAAASCPPKLRTRSGLQANAAGRTCSYDHAHRSAGMGVSKA